MAFYVFPLSEFWRISTSLGLTCLFALIFAWLVGRLQQEMTELATTDPLTGCRNRATLAESLTNQIKLCERYDRHSDHHQRRPDASVRQRDVVSLAQAGRPGIV